MKFISIAERSTNLERREKVCKINKLNIENENRKILFGSHFFFVTLQSYINKIVNCAL